MYFSDRTDLVSFSNATLPAQGNLQRFYAERGLMRDLLARALQYAQRALEPPKDESKLLEFLERSLRHLELYNSVMRSCFRPSKLKELAKYAPEILSDPLAGLRGEQVLFQRAMGALAQEQMSPEAAAALEQLNEQFALNNRIEAAVVRKF